MYIASAPLPLYIRGKVFESKGRTYYKDHGSMTAGELLGCHPWDGEEKPLKRCLERMLEYEGWLPLVKPPPATIE